MATEIEFDDQYINKFLGDMRGRLKMVNGGQRKFVAMLSAIVYRDIMDHFSKEQGEKEKWQHWSFWYALQMERLGKSGNKILQWTGRLRNNFKPTKARVSDGNITWFNDAKTKKGFPYAAAHNEGGPKLPKRDFMWASGKAVEELAQGTLNFLLDEGV